MYYEDIVSNFRFWTIDSGMKCQMYNNFLLGNGSGFVLKQVEITKIKRITLWFTISICISWHEDECWSNDSDQAPTNKDQHISSRWHLISSRWHFFVSFLHFRRGDGEEKEEERVRETKQWILLQWRRSQRERDRRRLGNGN